MKSGIYKIVNVKTGDFYIGSSVNLEKRRKSHTYLLKNNRNGCKILQNAWNKYGEDNFKWEILAYSPKEYLFKLEQFFVDCLEPKYNILIKDIRVPTSGKSEYKDKSLYVKYAKERLKNNSGFGQKNKQVEVYHKGKLIKTCESVSKCAEYLKYSISFISKAIKNKKIFDDYQVFFKV